jgi:NTP pyrophosphatase (non-canonical NTP hydrolase)
MARLDLGELQAEVLSWSVRNFGEQPSSRLLLGLVEELGELCHAHLKQEQGIRTSEAHEAARVDAVGDVVIFLCDYCARTGLSLEGCILDAWSRVRGRDWRSDPAGGGVP